MLEEDMFAEEVGVIFATISAVVLTVGGIVVALLVK